MKDGFIKVCAAVPDIRVADCVYNREQILKEIEAAEGAKLIVLPELCVTGYTCGDLFFQRQLLEDAKMAVLWLAEKTKQSDAVILVGAPVEAWQKLYNCAVILWRGEILGIVPKRNLPNYQEFYEQRHFTEGTGKVRMLSYGGAEVPFGGNIFVRDRQMESFCLGIEICEDLWTIDPPSNAHAQAGATVIANLSASNEVIAKEEYRRQLVTMQSAKLFAAYIYTSAGEGESTTDLVFSGDSMIAENGSLLARSTRFCNQSIFAEPDLEKLVQERKKTTTFRPKDTEDYTTVWVDFHQEETRLTRTFSKTPFVPQDRKKRSEYSEEILTIQAMGLKKRLVHTGAKHAVIGISGGLDSTLALLVTVRAFDLAGLDRKGISAVTMPCFGTTGRTYHNAVEFAKTLGCELKEIRIEDAVMKHFADIGHDPEVLDVTYENSQARERTQILMDIANQNGGLVIGTGDMSELALGWATYNGDHMSMYAVNAGVPKTLIRYLVDYEAERSDSDTLHTVLRDILDTPVSPELLPPKDGEIAQKTEHIVGPYELHDFFLYYLMRYGFSPKKIFRLAACAFDGIYDRAFILQWMRVFYRRFFSQQFKRSCIPDGPKVGSVALSPRGDWRMPSDASAKGWLLEIDELR